MAELKNGNGHANGHANRIEGYRDLYVRDPLPDQLPPQNLEAELKILGAMMLDNEVIEPVAEVVAAADFYRESHQVLFDAILAVYRQGLPADGIHVFEELERQGRFGEIDGDELLYEASNAAPHAANAVYHAEIVREKAIARRKAEAATEDIRDIYSNRYTAGEIVERSSARHAEVEALASDMAEAQYDGIRPWPEPVAPEGWYGIAGEIVSKIAPHTEADPVAIYIQLLAALGNLYGRGPHWRVEATRHALNLFVCVVGDSSKARKGTSWGHVTNLLNRVDETWVRDRIMGGLSSGEGMIWAVRDPIHKQVKIGGDPRLTGGGTREEEIDPGVADKRALFVESEFGGVLGNQGRDGNNLSSYIRQAWDSGNFRSLTKNSPVRTTGSHIGIIGHITGGELRRKLTSNDTDNGYANRFLWVCARRARYLPHGGRIHKVDFAREIHHLKGVVDFVRDMHPEIPIHKDRDARKLWEEVYAELSEPGMGLLGSVTDRAEAQVMRLATLFALLDFAQYVAVPHLRAALAVWKYCKQSAQFIFGDQLGDPDAEKLLRAIKESGASGMTLTAINRQVFHGHKIAAETAKLLAVLHRSGLIEQAAPPSEPDETKPTKGKRPPIVWRSKCVSTAENADFEYFAQGDDASPYDTPY